MTAYGPFGGPLWVPYRRSPSGSERPVSDLRQLRANRRQSENERQIATATGRFSIPQYLSLPFASIAVESPDQPEVIALIADLVAYIPRSFHRIIDRDVSNNCCSAAILVVDPIRPRNSVVQQQRCMPATTQTCLLLLRAY